MSRAPSSSARGDAEGTRARRERLETRAKVGGAVRARVESIADREAPRARGCEGTSRSLVLQPRDGGYSREHSEESFWWTACAAKYAAHQSVISRPEFRTRFTRPGPGQTPPKPQPAPKSAPPIKRDLSTNFGLVANSRAMAGRETPKAFFARNIETLTRASAPPMTNIKDGSKA